MPEQPPDPLIPTHIITALEASNWEMARTDFDAIAAGLEPKGTFKSGAWTYQLSTRTDDTNAEFVTATPIIP